MIKDGTRDTKCGRFGGIDQLLGLGTLARWLLFLQFTNHTVKTKGRFTCTKTECAPSLWSTAGHTPCPFAYTTTTTTNLLFPHGRRIPTENRPHTHTNAPTVIAALQPPTLFVASTTTSPRVPKPRTNDLKSLRNGSMGTDTHTHTERLVATTWIYYIIHTHPRILMNE